VGIAFVVLLAAVAVLAGPAGTPTTQAVLPAHPHDLPADPNAPLGDGIAAALDGAIEGAAGTGGAVASALPLGQPRVRTDKNCYLPGQLITITLRNVGVAPLAWDSLPDYEIENATIGTVRMIAGFQRENFHLDPGDSVSWVWDQKWDAWDANGSTIHKGEYVPKAVYTVNINIEAGFPIGEVATVATTRFTIGECLARINAGDDIVVDEGETFQFNPVIDITGNAVVKSVSWDLDPAVDSNGDGNSTNDSDLLGTTPSYAFGDDGVYNVTMNLHGFGVVSGMDRIPQDVVFALDSSTTMEWGDPLGLRKVASKAYVDRMVPDDLGAVVDFDSTARVVNGHHLSMNYTQIKEDIDTVDSSGDLFLSAGLLLSLYELRDYGNPAHTWIVIFMTGAESENPRDPYYIPRVISLAQDLGARIYTVGLNIVDPSLVTLMRNIALQTGGRYFSAATAGNLYKIYEDIQSETNTTKGTYFTVSDTLSVTVQNVPPTPVVEAVIPVAVTLRIAGEKYHDVTMVLYRDSVEDGRATAVRRPGNPDEQTVSLPVALAIQSRYDLSVEYTPEDDPLNGNAHGATPAWLTITSEDGRQLSFHRLFNVQQMDDWLWEFKDIEGMFLGRSVSLSAHITDPGNDDETVVWDWGDGTVETRVFHNDGTGPDPYPSPWGSPVDLTLVFEHAYAAAGSYAVSITVTDDDGGTTTLSFTLTVT